MEELSEEERTCPKCRGVMRRGEIQIPIERLRSQPISPYTSGMFFGGMPTLEEETVGRPYWEERTGEKKGVIFKREEAKRLTISGFRCTRCGYIELYAQERRSD
jgi:predicted nucleic-acid-binding Zn-ribbon protein